MTLMKIDRHEAMYSANKFAPRIWLKDVPNDLSLRETSRGSPGTVFLAHLSLRALLFGVGLALSLILAVRAEAATVVVPNGLATVEGDANNVLPFETGFPPVSHRYQQVFASSAFATLPGPSLITEIAVRPDAQFGNTFTVTIDAIQINLSTTGAPPDGLSETFADNVGADDTVVFSGSLLLTSGFTGPAAGPKDFDYIIPLQTPFLYDPSAGSLLLDFRNLSGAVPVTAFDAQFNFGDSVSRVLTNPFIGQDGTSPTGFADTLGLVVRFTAIPSVISVVIEIKPPTGPPVPINPSALGRIPVAVLSTFAFNAITQVDLASLTFGHTGDEASLAFCGARGEDVNGDGLLDLVCHFNTMQTDIVAGDTVAILKGHTLSGDKIEGSEAILTVPKSR